MYLSRIYIENYRSIEKLDLEFKKGRNIIVGRNNAGKSNIIKAIDFVLGLTSPTWEKSENITDNDFFKGKTSNDIFIWCEIARDKDEQINFDPINNTAIVKVRDNNAEYRINVNNFDDSKDEIFNFSGEEGENNLDSMGRKLWVGGKKYCKISYTDEFKDIHNFAFAFRCKKIGNKYEKEMVFLYRENPAKDWFISPGCRLREILLQSAVIPAFRDPKNQLNTAGWSWYGKLLRYFTKADAPELREAFKKVKEVSDSIFSDLQKQVSFSKIDVAFPGTKISFQFNPDSQQDIHKSALVYVDDGFNSQLQDKGSGIQSAVIIGLFDFYTREIAHTSGSSLLAIEEPELYLHPHGRRVISNRMDTFIDGGRNQAILSSHSSEFISNMGDQNIIVVKKRSDSTRASSISFDTPKKRQLLIKKQNAEMFFSDGVILVEGAEKYFVERIAANLGPELFLDSSHKRVLGKNWLDEKNISILNCGGKTELWKYCDVLGKLEIPYFVISDFDFLGSGLNEFLTNLGKPKPLSVELNTLKSQCSISGTIKSLNKLDAKFHLHVRAFLAKLLNNENVYVLESMLETYYKIKPVATKEQGVIETISNIIETNDPLSKYLDENEFKTALEFFLKNILKVNYFK